MRRDAAERSSRSGRMLRAATPNPVQCLPTHCSTNHYLASLDLVSLTGLKTGHAPYSSSALMISVNNYSQSLVPGKHTSVNLRGTYSIH